MPLTFDTDTAFRPSGFRALVSVSWLFILLAFVRPGEAADPEKWLMRINAAASTHSFVGKLVYLHDNRLEAMQVLRRVRRGGIQERLYALTGEAREVVRDQHGVRCIMPDRKVGVHDRRHALDIGFPRALGDNLHSLSGHYRFALGTTVRIADRAAQQVMVLPEDRYRYGYHLWADEDTGLLLRSDLVDGDGQMVERYVFIDIQIDPEISDEALKPAIPEAELRWFGVDMPQVNSSVQTSAWQMTSVPDGYHLSRHIRRMNPMSRQLEEHMVFTDGLSSVSVFIKESTDGSGHMMGLSRMGAMHAYRIEMENHSITVMGEVPHHTVKHLARSISYRP